MESFLSPPDAGVGERGNAADPGRQPFADGPDRTPDLRLAQRVLVVDDNVHSAESLALIINLWGHDTRIAYNGTKAIEMAREYRPDVVLLDIGLPGMDGYTVAGVLRNEPTLKSPVLLAMTGYGREEDQRKALEAGFDHHLLKPLELDVLEDLLAELAGTRR